MGEPLIRMQGVAKVFVTDEVETHALEGIDLEIQRGEYVSVSGPSGCGKSTFLRSLNRMNDLVLNITAPTLHQIDKSTHACVDTWIISRPARLSSD